MPVTEIQRTELINRLVEVLGEERTETLMQCILPEGRDQLATKDDLKALETTLRSEFKDEFTKIQAEFAEFKSEIRTEFAEFKSEIRTEFAEFKSEIRTELRTGMAKLTRQFAMMLIGFMVTMWATMIPIALAT